MDDIEQIKSETTSLCFLNVLWFERLREYMENTGGMDDYIAEFIEHCKAENRETFNKYK